MKGLKHILMTQNLNYTWTIIFSGGYADDSYDRCVQASTKLTIGTSFMIVAEIRVHIEDSQTINTTK